MPAVRIVPRVYKSHGGHPLVY